MTTEAITFRYIIVSSLPILFIALCLTGFFVWLKNQFQRIYYLVAQTQELILREIMLRERKNKK